MIMGGVSLIGKSHAINQDGFVVREVDGGHVLVVSDGLGSRRRSQAGSAAICSVACAVADARACSIVDDDDAMSFLADVHSSWIDILTRYRLKVEECFATALIAVKNRADIWLFRLGDGFIAASSDGATVALFDDKDSDFVNATDCLDVEFVPSLWQIRRLRAENFRGIIAATDGVTFEIDEENLKGIAEDFFDSYRNYTLGKILSEIETWLPTLTGGDDKTLAFLIQGANENVE